jgi:hypothetical protein
MNTASDLHAKFLKDEMASNESVPAWSDTDPVWNLHAARSWWIAVVQSGARIAPRRAIVNQGFCLAVS